MMHVAVDIAIKSVWFTSMTIKQLNKIIDIDKFIMCATT